MLVNKDKVENAVILRCEGRLDSTTSTQLENLINKEIDAGEKTVLLDFGGIDYLSSAGMRVLLSMTKRLKANEGSFKIFSLHEDVKEIIHLAGFEKILDIYAEEAGALAS